MSVLSVFFVLAVVFLFSEAAEVVQRLLEEGRSLRDSREHLCQRLASSVDTLKNKQTTISSLGTQLYWSDDLDKLGKTWRKKTGKKRKEDE